MKIIRSIFALFACYMITASCATIGSPIGTNTGVICAQRPGSSDGFARTPDNLGYRIYDSNGAKIELCALIESIKNSDVAFLGEIHTDTVAHTIEALLFQMAWDEHLSLSLEMFDRDVQPILDEYLRGLINEEHFIKSSRAWDNYQSDYRALVEFSKDNNVHIIASNAPGRYVNMVSRLGSDSLSSLSEESKRFLPPLPYPSASLEYEKRFREIMRYHQVRPQPPENDRKPGNVKAETNDSYSDPKKSRENEVFQDYLERALEAQSLWDTSMAWSIASHLKANPDGRVMHINGSFHSDYALGIPEHLEKYLPGLKTLTISIVPSQQFPEFNNSMKSLADFIIVTEVNNQRAD